jgi:hypothetical protein
MNTEPRTRVIFRTWRDHPSVIALFPDLTEGRYCTCYMHVGQHSTADYQYLLPLTRPATRAEYTPIARELTAIGYRLIIIRRRPRRPR